MVSVAVAPGLEHGLSSWGDGLSSSKACGALQDQGSNLYHLHRQVDSLPLSHQGSPIITYSYPSRFEKPRAIVYHICVVYLITYVGDLSNTSP